MKKIFSLLVVLSQFYCVFSQKIYFCENYSVNGEPTASTNSLTISPFGSSIYLLLNNNNNKLYSKKLYIYIDKQSGNTDFATYKTLSMPTNENASWVVYNYTFTEAGYYKVRFLNENYQTLATEYCTIQLAKATASLAESKNEALDASYYNHLIVTFCKSVDASYNAIGTSTTFSMVPNERQNIYVLIKNNNKSFKTNKIQVDIYKGKEYTEFVETKTYNMNPALTNFKFQYTFYYEGSYKFKIYNADNVFMNEACVTIHPK